MRPVSEMDETYLVPFDSSTLADAFAETDLDGCEQRLAYDTETDLPILKDGDMVVTEVLEDIPGGCLVRVAPLFDDPAGLAVFLKGRDSSAIGSYREASDRVLGFLEGLGAVPASRSKGRWRPIDQADRQTWGAHLVRFNAQKLRAEAAAKRAHAPYRAAAGAILSTLRAA